MTVRAKFKVDSIERTLGSREVAPGKYEPREQQTIKLSAVYGGMNASDENKKFWAASPSGQLTLTCVNAEAVAELKLGGEYYIDITPAS